MDKRKWESRKERNLYLFSRVDEKSVGEIVEKIVEINLYDDLQEEEKRGYERHPIKLHISSYGGSVYCGFSLVDAILASKTPVHTICLGKAMSMALAIMVAGHKRIAHPHSTFMNHQLSAVLWGDLTHIKRDVKECERLEALYDELVLSKTRILKEKLVEVKEKRQDWFISVDEALKLGIVDEIVQS
jgi:ATP-dependent Clp protease protease subunit